MTAIDTVTHTLNASAAATAWLNAFLATGQDEDRPILYRTLCVEFFREGIHFIACDGALLFRTWVPTKDAGEDSEWPYDFEIPQRAVVVLDSGHFALGFVRTLLAATKAMDFAELSLSIEPAPEQDGEPPLGASFSAEVLTLRALGQQLHCRLFEGEYVNWRNVQFGIAPAERVDGMKIAPRMFSAVGKLKGISAIECTFTGDETHIVLTGDGSFKGILMPMRRKEKEKPAPDPDAEEGQADAFHVHARQGEDGVSGTTVKVDGEWVPATQENMARAVKPVLDRLTGRDRAAGRDE